MRVAIEACDSYGGQGTAWLTGHGGWWLGGGTQGAQPVMQVTGRESAPPAICRISLVVRTRRTSLDKVIFFTLLSAAAPACPASLKYRKSER